MILTHIFATVTLLQSMIFMHEFGHWLYVRFILKKYVEIRFYYLNYKDWGLKVGFNDDYNDIEYKDVVDVLFSGIALGLLPILLFGLFLHWMYLIVVLPYLFIGCGSDFKQLYNIYRSKKR